MLGGRGLQIATNNKKRGMCFCSTGGLLCCCVTVGFLRQSTFVALVCRKRQRQQFHTNAHTHTHTHIRKQNWSENECTKVCFVADLTHTHTHTHTHDMATQSKTQLFSILFSRTVVLRTARFCVLMLLLSSVHNPHSWFCEMGELVHLCFLCNGGESWSSVG